MEEREEYKVEETKKITDEKTVQSAEIVGSYIPWGVTSFTELSDAQDAQASAQTVEMLANQFQALTRNIFSDGDIENKAAAISSVVGELETLLGEATSKEKGSSLQFKERMVEACKFLMGGEMTLVTKQGQVVQPVVGAVAVNVVSDSASVNTPAVVTASGSTARAFVRAFVDEFPEGANVVLPFSGDLSTLKGTVMSFAPDDIIPPFEERLAATGAFDGQLTSSLSFSTLSSPSGSTSTGTKSTSADAILGPSEFLAAVIADRSNVSDSHDTASDWHIQEYYTKKRSGAQDQTAFKAKWSRAFINDLPNSSFLHILPGGKKDSEGKTVPRTLRMFPYKDGAGKVDLPHVRNALARIPQSNRISASTKTSLTAKARRLLKANTKETDGLLDRITDMVKRWLGENDTPEHFTLWKEADQLRWAAWFSNNYRDDDDPPEIISADAHRDFVKAVDAGEWPKPELWFWHIKGSRFGQTDLVAYAEDTGFTLAAGTIDVGKESIAQYCADNGYRVSHGMPSETIERSTDDPTVITSYRTKEVSFLPADAAANKFTSLALKEDNMELPEKKLEELKAAGFDVEALLAGLPEGAEAEGRERKEVEGEEVESEQEVKAEEVVESVAEEETATEEVEPEMVTESEIEAEPNPSPFTQPQMEALADAFSTAMAPLMERMDVLEAEPEEALEEAPKEKQIELPSDFLGKLLHSRVIGNDATRVDGRAKEAKDKPAEAESDADNPVRLAHPMAEQTVNRLLRGATFQELQESTAE